MLDPESSALAWAGLKIPHPDPYVGEADLEKFEGFVTGLLQWLSLNLLLGSDANSTSIQVRYLGMCLSRDALEWYFHNVEHY